MIMVGWTRVIAMGIIKRGQTLPFKILRFADGHRHERGKINHRWVQEFFPPIFQRRGCSIHMDVLHSA